MKIRSTLGHNLGLNARYELVGEEGKQKLKGMPKRVTVPAGSLLELDDALWPAFKDAAQPALEKGALVMVEMTEADKEEAEAAKVEEAKKLIAKEEKKAKKAKAPSKEA